LFDFVFFKREVRQGHYIALRSKYMAQIPKGRLVEGPYQPICRDSAMYFSITVPILWKSKNANVW